MIKTTHLQTCSPKKTSGNIPSILRNPSVPGIGLKFVMYGGDQEERTLNVIPFNERTFLRSLLWTLNLYDLLEDSSF